MKHTFFIVVFCMLFAACSKSDNTDYATPPPPNTGERWIKFGYEGDVYGIPPIYTGLADTPEHIFEGTGISESDFVKTKTGDTIHILIPLCSENTKPLVTVVKDLQKKDPVPPVITEIPTTDATVRFRILIK